jgi:hypothetical protein
MEISPTLLVCAHPNQVHSEMGEDIVVLSMQRGAYFNLNPVGAFIWKKIQQPVSTQALRDAILEEFEVTAKQCEQDLIEILTELKNNGLLEIKS